MPATTTPKSLRPLLHAPFTPYITNGNEEKSRCNNCCRFLFRQEAAMEECPCSLFSPPTVEKLNQNETDATTAQRILDALEYQRREFQQGLRNILPKSPYEGLEFREKLKMLDKFGADIHEAQRKRELLNQYASQKAEHHRLHDLLPRMQADAERAGEEKSRKEHQLNRKRLRRQVLEEEASERQARREERAERRQRREMEGVDQESLLPQPRRQGGRVIRRIRDVEIPSLDSEIEELERDIAELEKTVEDFRRTRDRVRDLNEYLASHSPPDLDEYREENDRLRLGRIRASLIQRSPRMFNYLFADLPEDHVQHEKDFDEFYELIDDGHCPCGTAFSEHLVLVKPFPKEAERLEEQLFDFVEAEEDASSSH